MALIYNLAWNIKNYRYVGDVSGRRVLVVRWRRPERLHQAPWPHRAAMAEVRARGGAGRCGVAGLRLGCVWMEACCKGIEMGEALTRRQEVDSPASVLRRPGSVEVGATAPDRRLLLQRCGMVVAAMGVAVVMAGGLAWRSALLLVAIFAAPLALRSGGAPGRKPCTDFGRCRRRRRRWRRSSLVCVVVVVPSLPT